MDDTFSSLTESLTERLHQLRYSQSTINHYHSTWRCIAAYLNDNGISNFGDDIAEQFFQSTYGFSLKDPSSSYTSNIRHHRRAVMVLMEYQKSGTFYRRKCSKERCFQECYKPAIDEFMDEVSETMASTSFRQIRSRMEAFLGYLFEHGCIDFQQLDKKTILAYWETRAHVCRTTQIYDAYALRKFFNFLFEHGYTTVDNSVFVPNIKGNHKGQIPSFYTTDELTSLLASVDRSNPTGKRDYALLLLTIRYGMRVGDIRDLKLSDFDWNKSMFSFCENKTTDKVTFPILDDVATALIDYFQNGRPETDCDNVFIRHIAPYEAFADNDNLSHIISKYMRFSGLSDINVFNHRKQGMHVLRHSIAGNMLDQGVPLPTISEILGQRSTETTMIYTKIGIGQLKTCALEVD